MMGQFQLFLFVENAFIYTWDGILSEDISSPDDFWTS